jgi:hypothetical protein
MLVDEAQDLTVCQLRMFLCGVTSLKAFTFCADTAQAIEFGRSFSFASLKDTILEEFSRVQMKEKGQKTAEMKEEEALIRKRATVINLRKNFRSHQGILNVSSRLVARIIREFRSTTDPLPPEISDLKGTAPVAVLNISAADFASVLKTNIPGCKIVRGNSSVGDRKLKVTNLAEGIRGSVLSFGIETKIMQHEPSVTPQHKVDPKDLSK